MVAEYAVANHSRLEALLQGVRLQPVETVKFGDTHEGSFGVRVAAWLEEPDPDYVPVAKKGDVRPTEPKRTGLISNSAGGMKEKGVRSKKALWADYSGEYKGEKVGIAMFDHPGNPRHPTYWPIPFGQIAPTMSFFIPDTSILHRPRISFSPQA